MITLYYKICLSYKYGLIAGLVGGMKKTKNLYYVIFECSSEDGKTVLSLKLRS